MKTCMSEMASHVLKIAVDKERGDRDGKAGHRGEQGARNAGGNRVDVRRRRSWR